MVDTIQMIFFFSFFFFFLLSRVSKIHLIKYIFNIIEFYFRDLISRNLGLKLFFRSLHLTAPNFFLWGCLKIIIISNSFATFLHHSIFVIFIILLTGWPGGPAIPSTPLIPGGPGGPSLPLSPRGPAGPYLIIKHLINYCFYIIKIYNYNLQNLILFMWIWIFNIYHRAYMSHRSRYAHGSFLTRYTLFSFCTI